MYLTSKNDYALLNSCLIIIIASFVYINMCTCTAIFVIQFENWFLHAIPNSSKRSYLY